VTVDGSVEVAVPAEPAEAVVVEVAVDAEAPAEVSGGADGGGEGPA
jgi:hypothetical protein